jgi:hypothetical protein
MCWVLILLLVVGIVIALIVCLSGKSNDDPVDPNPPPTPPVPSEMVNPYYLKDDGSFKVDRDKISGKLVADQ